MSLEIPIDEVQKEAEARIEALRSSYTEMAESFINKVSCELLSLSKNVARGSAVLENIISVFLCSSFEGRYVA